jgi:VanZ family protein
MKDRKKVIRYICRIAAPLMMAVIFYFSSRPGPVSDVDSMVIGRIISEVVVPDFKEMDAKEQIRFVSNINHSVRKTAHFTEYAILAALLIGALDTEDKKKRRVLLEAVAIAALYAASDEFHQTFVPGRMGMFRDVLIDTAGAICGATLVTVIMRFSIRDTVAAEKPALHG